MNILSHFYYGPCAWVFKFCEHFCIAFAHPIHSKCRSPAMFNSLLTREDDTHIVVVLLVVHLPDLDLSADRVATKVAYCSSHLPLGDHIPETGCGTHRI